MHIVAMASLSSYISVTFLFSTIALVSALDPTFSPIDLKDSDGNQIIVHNIHTCYTKFYKYACDDGTSIAPIKYVFGAKYPTFQQQNNCSLIPPPAPCCEYSNEDCTFESTKDIIHIWENCGYRKDCNGQRGAWNSIRESDKHGCPDSFKAEARQLYTQYAYLRYACFPPKMDVRFEGGSGKGKGLSLKSEHRLYDTGIKLQCQITGTAGINVQVLDLRLCESSQCVPKLVVSKNGGDIASYTSEKLFGLQIIASIPGQPTITVTFSSETPIVDRFHIWLYVTSFTGTGDVSIDCDQPVYITTTTTTTTTTAAPTTTTTTTVSPTTTVETTTLINTKDDTNVINTPVSVLKPKTSTTRYEVPSTMNSPTKSIPESSEQKSIKDLIKYSSIAGAALGGVLFAFAVCYCKIKHQRMRQKNDDRYMAEYNLTNYPPVSLQFGKHQDFYA